MRDLETMLERARQMSWERFGKRLTVYLPGMFSYNGLSGNYPALSITGRRCALQCDHCRGTTLAPMIPAETPDRLIEKSLRLAEKGNDGILISGGCDQEGRLPWEAFFPAIQEIKRKTDLYISIHCGLLDDQIAGGLKQAGVDQALIDVIGDDDTFRRVYKVPFGVSRVVSTLQALERARLSVVPHIVCGLHFGHIKGEKRAIGIISQFDVEHVVIVSLMTIPGTPLWGASTPGAEEVAGIIAEARTRIPRARISLGCARQRGDIRLEILAIDAGVNRMALPSEEALKRARAYGLEIRYQRTCCSVSRDVSKQSW